MATLKGVSRSTRGESLSGKIMVDTVRGQLRVRAWPKKRGTPKSEAQLWWIDWFRQANKLAKYADAASLRRAIDITANSGMYPRDILLAAMRGRLYSWWDQTGNRWHSMAAIQDISDSLDVLAQAVGSVLVRSTDRWRAPPVGAPGDVLTHMGPAAGAEWQPAAGGGGFAGGCWASRNSSFNVASGASVAIPFDAEIYDTAGIHDPVTNNTRLTVPVGTVWCRLHSQLRWSANFATAFNFRKNGVYTPEIGYMSETAAAGQQLVSHVLPVVAGDYFESWVYNGAGGTRTILQSTGWPSFSMELL